MYNVIKTKKKKNLFLRHIQFLRNEGKIRPLMKLRTKGICQRIMSKRGD